jgi:hypothetical protein
MIFLVVLYYLLTQNGILFYWQRDCLVHDEDVEMKMNAKISIKVKKKRDDDKMRQ